MWVVIASGQSLCDDDVEYVRQAHEQGKCKVVAISNVGIDKAPWADFLVSHDSAWWRAHPEAADFKGRKFTRMNGVRRCEQYIPVIPGGCNSGLMGMLVARDIGKAKKIILLGFDLHGTHYFGAHQNLKNTTESRYEHMAQQFTRFSGCEVINSSTSSRLTIFPKIALREAL